VIAPSRKGADYWCRITSTRIVHKGLTLETARARILDEVARADGQRGRSKDEALHVVTVAPLAKVKLPEAPADFVNFGPARAAPQPRAFKNGKKKGRKTEAKPRPAAPSASRVTWTGLSAPSQPTHLKPCPICGALIAKAAKHYRKCHPEMPVPARPARAPQRIRIEGSVPLARSSTVPKRQKRSGKKFKVRSTNSDAEITADATRLYSPRYRDKGRSGSHASHDRYDGDAQP
jgi:hypothetical protein